MIIKKNIEVGINIYDPISVWTDPDNIMGILRNKYVKKCFRGCYIVSINRILRHGECVINQDGDPTFGLVPVTMEVTAIEYAAGEIINGCVVQNRDASGYITCSTDIASIILLGHKSIESITNGQIISIRVVGTKYNQGSHSISINAIPLMFTNKAFVYRLDRITEQDKVLVANVLERIAVEEAEAARLKKESAAWDNFAQMLYAYKEEQKPPAGAQVVPIMSLMKGAKVKYVARDPRINPAQPSVYGYMSEVFPDEYKKRYDVVPSNVLLLMLEDYCAHLRTIREMIDIYSTEAIVNAHRNLWQIYKKNKF